ncbi:MAG: PP2C family serine/threonine-protein phosphatase [Rhodospirillaceae bacterium]
MTGALRCLAAGATHAGAVRSVNEDAFMSRPDAGLFAVADGVGGHTRGDVASRLVCDRLAALPVPATAPAFYVAVRDAIQDANASLRAEAARRSVDAVATTVVALLVFDHHYACVWAGDSRLYICRDGRLDQISRDHSYVQEMVDLGLLSPAEAEGHANANAVTRAVGADAALEIEAVQDELAPGDVFLLCSDGLSKVVPDEEAARILAAAPLDDAPTALIEAAIARGAPDNVTVVVVRIAEA